LTGTKHSAFSTNHLTDIDKTTHNYNQQQHLKPLLNFLKSNKRDQIRYAMLD